jgi:hypothetical protein
MTGEVRGDRKSWKDVKWPKPFAQGHTIGPVWGIRRHPISLSPYRSHEITQTLRHARI